MHLHAVGSLSHLRAREITPLRTGVSLGLVCNESRLLFPHKSKGEQPRPKNILKWKPETDGEMFIAV